MLTENNGERSSGKKFWGSTDDLYPPNRYKNDETGGITNNAKVKNGEVDEESVSVLKNKISTK